MSYYSESRKGIVDAEITEIFKKTNFDSGSIKNEFKIKVPDKENEYTCVYWGRTGIEKGDKVRLKLWKLPDNILLIDNILILQKGEQDERETV